jgi:hypothetical protein
MKILLLHYVSKKWVANTSSYTVQSILDKESTCNTCKFLGQCSMQIDASDEKIRILSVWKIVS